MKFCILKERIIYLLAKKLAENILNSDKEDLIRILQYSSLGGFELLDDQDLLENIMIHVPELEKVELIDVDSEKFVFHVKGEHMDEASVIKEIIEKDLKIISFA